MEKEQLILKQMYKSKKLLMSEIDEELHFRDLSKRQLIEILMEIKSKNK